MPHSGTTGGSIFVICAPAMDDCVKDVLLMRACVDTLNLVEQYLYSVSTPDAHHARALPNMKQCRGMRIFGSITNHFS